MDDINRRSEMNTSTARWQDSDPAWQAATAQHWERLSPLVKEVLAGPAPSEDLADWADSTGAVLFAMSLDTVDRAALALQGAKNPRQQQLRQKALQNNTQGTEWFGRRLAASLAAYAQREHPDGSPEQLLALVRARYMHLRDGACAQSEAIS
jgi:hypothetical protein